MAHETESIINAKMTLESMQNYMGKKERRERRKQENGATGTLESSPSPVASALTSDACAETAAAMKDLAIETEEVKEDGLVKLPVFPSSGRLPRTPPSSPVAFLVHSPEKDQLRVAPMSPAVQQLQTSVELTMLQMLPLEAREKKSVTKHVKRQKKESDDVETKTTDVKGVKWEREDATVLSNTFAEMVVSNKGEMKHERPLDGACAQVIVEAPVTNDHVIMTTKGEASGVAIDETLAAVAASVEPVKGVEISVADSSSQAEAVKTTELAVAQEDSAREYAREETLQAIEEVTSPPALVKEESQESPESLPSPHCDEKREESLEQNAQATLSVASRLFVKEEPSESALTLPNNEDAGTSTQETSSEPQLQSCADIDVKAPPAVMVMEVESRSSAARSTDDAPKTTATKRLASDNDTDAMKKPTASSRARAAAAEARKALLRNAASKKAPLHRVMRNKLLDKSVTPPPVALANQHKSTLAPPAPIAKADGNVNQRNVKRRFSATHVEAASNRLYEDAKETKARKDARRAELQETYSFAPQVNTRRSSPDKAKSSDRFSRLHAHAKEIQEKKRELLQQREREGCTFAPTISARAKRLAQPSTGPRYENLYKNAQEMKQKREEKLLEKDKSTDEQCPFKPKITATKLSLKRTKPLYDSEHEKQKRLALEQKRIEAEMSKCTFKPKVSAKRTKSRIETSSDPTAKTSIDANPFSRLYQGSIDRTERLEKLRQERDEKEKAQAPFQPKISARSRMLKSKAKTKEPFHERLYNKDYMKKLESEREQRRLEEEQQFTFKPAINEPPEDIKAKVNERASPQKNIFERLYDEKDKLKEKIELGEELRLQKEMAECTFRPQIEVNNSSSNDGSITPVWKRLLSYDKAQVIEEREKMKEQLEMQECTFKPEVTTKSSPTLDGVDRPTADESDGSILSTKTSFITRRRASSPQQQSPETKNGSIGRIMTLTKISPPAAKMKLSRAHSMSQPSSVSKPTTKRWTSFSCPKFATSS